jgi:hypothetical protein
MYVCVCGTHTHSRSEWTLDKTLCNFSKSVPGAWGGEPVGGTDLLSPTACAPAVRHPHPRTVQVTRVRGSIYNTFTWGARYTSLVAILYQQFSGKTCICRHMCVSIKKRTSFSPLIHTYTQTHMYIPIYIYMHTCTHFFFFFFLSVCVYVFIYVYVYMCAHIHMTYEGHTHTYAHAFYIYWDTRFLWAPFIIIIIAPHQPTTQKKKEQKGKVLQKNKSSRPAVLYLRKYFHVRAGCPLGALWACGLVGRTRQGSEIRGQISAGHWLLRSRPYHA